MDRIRSERASQGQIGVGILHTSILCFVHKSASSRSVVASSISPFGTPARSSSSMSSALARLVELDALPLLAGDPAGRRRWREKGVEANSGLNGACMGLQRGT